MASTIERPKGSERDGDKEIEFRKKLRDVIDPADQTDVLLEIKPANQPFYPASMFTSARFVISGNHELNVRALPANYCRSTNEIFLSFDRREMADHAHAQFLVFDLFFGKEVFPSSRKSIHIDAVMNQHNILRAKDAPGAKFVGHCLRNSDDAIRAAKTQLVRSVHRKKNVTSKDQMRGRPPSDKRRQWIVARDVRVDNLNAVRVGKAGKLQRA